MTPAAPYQRRRTRSPLEEGSVDLAPGDPADAALQLGSHRGRFGRRCGPIGGQEKREQRDRRPG